ncbi:MAG: hypothetical protein HRF50_10645 [Phycisphaerae bacterium]
MSTLTKVFIVLTSVLSVALSCLFISAAAQWDNWKALAQTYQVARDAAITHEQNAVAAAQASLALKAEELAARTRELEEARAAQQRAEQELAQVRSELAQTKNERIAFEAGRAKLQEILSVTTGELKSLQQQHQTVLDQNIDLQTRNGRLNGRVLELTTNVTILNDQIRNLQEKLYASEQRVASAQRVAAPSVQPAAVATPAPGVVVAKPAAAGEIKGRITAVQGTYASIDVGESSGVSVGMTFMVYRGTSTYLGELVVDKVRPNEAGGKLVLLTQGAISVGDLVTNAID